MHHLQRPLDTATLGAPSAAGPRSRARRLPAAAAVLLVLAAAPAAVAGLFPEAAVTLLIDDTVDSGVTTYGTAEYPLGASTEWARWRNSSSSDATFDEALTTSGISADARGAWDAYYLAGTDTKRANWAYLVAKASQPYDPNYLETQWTSFQIEFDIDLNQATADGVIWAAQDIDGDTLPNQGYLFRLTGRTPGSTSEDLWPFTANDVTSGTHCPGWELRQITGENASSLLGSGFINSNCLDPANPSATYTVSDPSDDITRYLLYDHPYRVRLSWFCGNLRVQIVRIDHPSGAPAATYKGCGAACGTGSADIDDCWCTVLEWTPLEAGQSLGPGAAGIWASYQKELGSGTNQYDNIEIGHWDFDCDLVCGDWQGWTESRTDVIPFKLLYEAGIFDISAGRNIEPPADRGKIDIATQAPAFDATYNHSLDDNPYCNGWNLLADLPNPAETANLDTIIALLEPMHSAIAFESDGSGGFNWVRDFDNEPFLGDGVTPNPDFNPVPIVADGSTPINGSLLQAFDWYVAQRTTGEWFDDPYEDCRLWYVILITDGEEACEFSGGVRNPSAVCEPGQAASKFANPEVLGVDPLPVYTIGFSEQVAADSPLACIADQTGGLFLTAENASELSDALYEVFYRVEGAKRSFSPFKIAPPPSGSGGNPTRDYLAVYPLLQPQERSTLWNGNLWAFPLSSEQPSLPTIGDCEVDTSQMAWNALDTLEAQLAAHTPGNPQRFVFMGSDSSGSWVRHDLATIPTNSTLRNEFEVLLDRVGDIDDVVVQQVVNFVRNIYMDSDSDPGNPGPPPEPRPAGYPVLGDFFHSQPVVVNPPNSPLYFYNYGFAASGERGAHDYGIFMDEQAKRRRVVLAGANDGMLHVFDGGVWNRDRVNENDFESDPYDQIHDLGNGTELFAWVPRAVMDNLYDMTSGGSLEHSEHQYMVDGPITTGDAFIDYDGDSDREWRTVALATMRRGGRGIVALDITQADPTGGSPDYIPSASTFPGCSDGSTTGCRGEYPKVLWEFTDALDDDANGEWDLGWTWSKPAIARIPVYNSSDPQLPNDVFVAFFGGGWDPTNSDSTGNFFYGVDLATGAVVYKENMNVDLPGGVTALDSDIDGFHDRIYFADSDGGVHRLQFPSPSSSSATGADAGNRTRIFDFRAASAGFVDRQEFFTRPVPVPVLFNGATYTWGLVLGSGDRADLKREDSGIDHVYFLVDTGDTTTRGEGDLLAVDYSELDGSFECETDALTPPYYGWYLSLRDTEKVVNEASVFNGYVFVATFDPSTATATDPPNSCEGSSGEETTEEGAVVCRAAGVGRGYQLWYECGLGKYDEFNDILTGQAIVSIDGESNVVWTDTFPEQKDYEEPLLESREHSVMNWRQE